MAAPAAPGWRSRPPGTPLRTGSTTAFGLWVGGYYRYEADFNTGGAFPAIIGSTAADCARGTWVARGRPAEAGVNVNCIEPCADLNPKDGSLFVACRDLAGGGKVKTTTVTDHGAIWPDFTARDDLPGGYGLGDCGFYAPDRLMFFGEITNRQRLFAYDLDQAGTHVVGSREIDPLRAGYVRCHHAGKGRFLLAWEAGGRAGDGSTGGGSVEFAVGQISAASVRSSPAAYSLPAFAPAVTNPLPAGATPAITSACKLLLHPYDPFAWSSSDNVGNARPVMSPAEPLLGTPIRQLIEPRSGGTIVDRVAANSGYNTGRAVTLGQDDAEFGKYFRFGTTNAAAGSGIKLLNSEAGGAKNLDWVATDKLFTIALWLKIVADSATFQVILDSSNTGATADGLLLYLDRWSATQWSPKIILRANNADQIAYEPNFRLDLNVAYSLMVVCNGPNQPVQMWRCPLSTASSNIDTSGTYREQSGGNMGTDANGATGAVAMTFGGRSDSDAAPLNANVGGLRFENTAWALTEFQQHHDWGRLSKGQ